MTFYFAEPTKYVKGYKPFSFGTNLSDKYGKKILDTAMKTELDAAKTASKKWSIEQ